MTYVNNYLRAFSNGNTVERLVLSIISLIALAIVSGVVYFLFRVIFVRKVYSDLKVEKGVVTNMDYTPPRTTTIYNGKTTTTTHHPAQHDVYIKSENLELSYDHERLYQTVRLDDDVEISYQDKYEYYTWQNKTEATPEGIRTISITSPKGRVVEINDKKQPADPILLRKLETPSRYGL